MEKQRIQKIIAQKGFCSRRKAEMLIRLKKVSCNGKIAKLGDLAAFDDLILVDGVLLNNKENKRYIMLNKPTGFVTTTSDEKNRKTVLDLLKGVKERVYPVGRLDINTSGLLFLTNDGEFANFVMHPSSNLEKTYRVTVEKKLSSFAIKSLKEGVLIEGKKTAKCKIKIISLKEDLSVFLIVLHEGRKRQIRKMVKAVLNCEVKKLTRLQIGPIKLNGLPKGHYKDFSVKELELIRKEISSKREKKF